MESRPGARRTLPTILCALGSLLLLTTAVFLPGAVDGALLTGPSGSAPLSSELPAVYTGSFAERAGYSPAFLDGVTGLHPLTSTMSVVVTFRSSDPSLFQVPAAGARPLTVAQIGDRFGLTPTAYRSAEQYFLSQGLTIQHAGKDRLSLTVAGSAASIARAFATTLVSGMQAGRSVSLPSSPPALPAGLQSEVAGVTGLSSGWDRFTLPLTPLRSVVASTPAQGPGDLVTPAVGREIYDASKLYNVSDFPHYATGENIVLLLWGDGYDPADIGTFFGSYYPSSTFPAVSVRPVPIDGAPAPAASAINDPSQAPQELTLDLEWAGSFAPGATLYAVYAPDGPATDNYSPTDATMADALHEAVVGISGVNAISMSFGTAEKTAAGLQAAWQTDLAEATQEQITLLGATGDTGGDTRSTPSCTGPPQPEYPASNPDVLAVGGTDPTLARGVFGQVTGLASESAWAGSGGGYSGQYAAPSWQEVGSAALPIKASGFRGMPDVSAAATQDFVYYNGQQQAGAGTSFATPLWAGLIAEMDALHGSPFGWVTPRLYSVGAAEPNGSIGQGLVDVTAGSNCLGPATIGWDTATGWGSPRALLLYEDLTATFVNLSIAASPAPVGPGGSLLVTAHLANSSTGGPIPGVPVFVTVTSDTTFGPCAGTFGHTDPTTNSSGDVAVPVAIPACYLGSRALVKVEVTADGLFGSNQTTVGVNLLGFLGLGSAAVYPASIAVYVLIMGAAITVGSLLGRGPAARKGEPRRRRRPYTPPPRTLAAPPPPPTPHPPTVVEGGQDPSEPIGVPLPPPAQPNPTS
jgi:kumamolisin